jgi:MoxR-like ATPase
MILTAKAHALLHGRLAVTPEDIRAVVYPVFRHRILVNFRAESEGIRSDSITSEILDKVHYKAS